MSRNLGFRGNSKQINQINHNTPKTAGIVNFKAMQEKTLKGAKVRVKSGDREFESFVEMVEWDWDQWAFLIYGEWFCQSEVEIIDSKNN